MKKVVLLFPSLLFGMSIIFSQTIKLENGLAISSMKSEKLTLLDQNICSYSIALGCDYLKHKYFYLSSEIGYIRKGGKDKDFIIDFTPTTIIEKLDYLHVNTTFRAKYPFNNNSHVFIGFGPKIDFLLSSNHPKFIGLREVYTFEKISLGFMPEIGFNKSLTNNILIGADFSYLFNVNKVGKSEYDTLSNNVFLFFLSLAYRFQ